MSKANFIHFTYLLKMEALVRILFSFEMYFCKF